MKQNKLIFFICCWLIILNPLAFGILAEFTHFVLQRCVAENII